MKKRTFLKIINTSILALNIPILINIKNEFIIKKFSKKYWILSTTDLK